MKGEEIIQYFEQHPADSLTIHHLSSKISKSYGWTHQHAKSLSEAGMLHMQRIGASILCKPDIRNELMIGALCWATSLRSATFLHANDNQAIMNRIKANITNAIAIAHVENSYIVLSTEGHGRHAIDGHEITFVQPTKEALQRMQKGIIIYGYERFWRAWGDTHD